MSTELTLAELAQFKGENDSSVYIAVKGIIYDVTAAREFYGPGGNYHVFAGRECARALASMKIDESYCDDNLEGLDEKSLKILDDWIKKFNDKYPIIGKVVLFHYNTRAFHSGQDMSQFIASFLMTS